MHMPTDGEGDLLKLYTLNENYCRWLHISDLHVLNDSQQESCFGSLLYGQKGRSRDDSKDLMDGGLRHLIREQAVDCIILTGDVFDKGRTENHKIIRKMLAEVYSNMCRSCTMA